MGMMQIKRHDLVFDKRNFLASWGSDNESFSVMP